MEQPIPFPSASSAPTPTIESYTAINPSANLVAAMEVNKIKAVEGVVSNLAVKTYSEVNHALNMVKEKTENIAVSSVPPTTQTFKIGGKEFKIHKVLDPDCEACQ
jgi:hypothetical protein